MSTISFPTMFNKNKYNLRTSLSYNIQSVNESLKSLLSTRTYELLGDPNYGCDIINQLFDLQGQPNIYELKQTVINAINKYLPFIICSTEDIKIYSDDKGHYAITVHYYLPDRTTQDTTTIILGNALSSS